MRAALCLLVLLLSSAAGKDLPWKWPGWGEISTSTWGSNSSCCHTTKSLHCCSGIDGPAEGRFKAKFDLIFLDNGIGTPGCNFSRLDGGNDTMLDCHRHRSAGAAAIRPFTGLHKPIFTYRQISAELEGADLDDPVLSKLMVTADDRGNPVLPGRMDWRKPGAVQWYADHVIGEHTANDSNFNGVFIDGPISSSQMCCDANLTLASKRAMFIGVATMLKTVSALLAQHGKVITASLGAHFSNLTEFYPPGYITGGPLCAANADPGSMEPCCAFGEAKFYDIIGPYRAGISTFTPFRQFNIPSRDFGDAAHGGNDTLGCAAAIVDAELEMRHRPAFYCNNDGWPNKTDGGTAIARHEVSLAAYLVAAHENSYFSSGLHWTDLVPGTQLKAWPWWPDYDEGLGAPLGPYTRKGFVFTRSFKDADVRIDCGNITASIQFRKKGPPFQKAPPAAPAPAAATAGCADNLDCSLSGVCSDGVCRCDAAWHGANCEYMALTPTNAANDFKEPGVSTWGGSIVNIPRSGAVNGTGDWHMYAAEMMGGCGLTSWQSNSQVVHATAPTPLGPWTRQPGATLHVWAHCPNAAVSPDGDIVLPRLWCTPIKYPAGVPGSCKAGVRSCLADGQCCRDGASPCGFKLHEGNATVCTNKPPVNFRGFAGDDEAVGGDGMLSGVDGAAVEDPELRGPAPGNQSSFVSFPVSRDPFGEFTENATFEIVGWPGIPSHEHDGFYGIVAPWIAANGTTWMFNEAGGGILIRAPCWNCTYELVCETCLPENYGEDPMLWLDKNENLHVVYHKFAGSDYGGEACTETGGCGGHAYSADGGATWRAGPTVYNATIAYADGPTQRYLTRQRPHVVLDPATRELVALSTGVTVCAVPNCTVGDAWPGYTDRGLTSVQPFRRTTTATTELIDGIV